jgi:predicted transcriptional regulator YdeE
MGPDQPVVKKRGRMISMGGLCAAVRKSLTAQLRERLAEEARLTEKRRQQETIEAQWAAELKRREQERLDEDGSRAAERKAREEQRERDQLDFMAGMILRRQAKLS